MATKTRTATPKPPTTAAEHGAAAGLPTRTVYCPSCDTKRKSQQLLDHPDPLPDNQQPPRVYECLTCGHEFAEAA